MNVKYNLEEKILEFEITEELDHHISERIRRRADYEIQRFMPKKVVFDFNRVIFMDSAGVGLIIGRYKTVQSFGGRMELINVGEKIKKVFDMSGVSKIIPIINNKYQNKLAN